MTFGAMRSAPPVRDLTALCIRGTELLVTNGGDATIAIMDAASGKLRISAKLSVSRLSAFLACPCLVIALISRDLKVRRRPFCVRHFAC